MPLIRLLQALAASLVFATALLLGHMTAAALGDLRRTSAGLEAIDRLQLALRVTEMASRERGPTNGMLGDDLPHTPAYAKALAEARQRTDTAFDALLSGVAPRADLVLSVHGARTALDEARAVVDRLLNQPKAERSSEAIGAAVRGMVAVIPTLAPCVTALATESQSDYPDVGDDVQAALLAAELREYTGLLGSHFTAALSSGQPLTAHAHDEIGHTRGRIEELSFLIGVRVAGPAQSPAVTRAWQEVRERYFERALKLAEGVIAASGNGARYGMDPAQFAARYVPDMNSILGLRDVLLQQARNRAVDAHERSWRTLVAVLASGALLLVTLLMSIVLVQRRILAPLAAIARAVHALARNKLTVELPRTRANDEMAAVIGAVELLRERQMQRLALERERDELIKQLRDQSNTDALTGLANRRGFFETGEHVLALARRHGFAVAAILLDVDHFKRVNDRFGHSAGDVVLFSVAEVIRSEMRDSDLAGRIGGEEFVLLLSHCTLEQGLVFAERLRAAIESVVTPTALAGATPPLHATASLGVAAFGPHCPTLESLISRADEAMYRAKTAGRNCVMSDNGEPRDATTV